MKPLRPQLRGLIFKLTLFYVLLSLPSLVLVETGILVYEFNEFMAGVEGGSLVHATQDAAGDLARDWPHDADTRYLAPWTEAFVLRLQRPHGGLLRQDSYILTELSIDPLSAAALDTDGHILAAAPTTARSRMRVPAPDSAEWRALAAGGLDAVSDSPYRVRRALAPIQHNGALHGYLLVELNLPVPWHRFLLDWPGMADRAGYLLRSASPRRSFTTWVRAGSTGWCATAAWAATSPTARRSSRDELGNRPRNSTPWRWN